MPALTMPTDPVRINAGGTIVIDDGTDTISIVNLEPGSLQETVGLRETLEYTDRDALKQPVEGPEQMSELSLSFKMASTVGADNPLDDFLTQASADGKAREFTVTIQRPHKRGGATGFQAVWQYCSIPASGIRINSSEQFDTVELTFRSRNTKPSTWDEY